MLSKQFTKSDKWQETSKYTACTNKKQYFAVFSVFTKQWDLCVCANIAASCECCHSLQLMDIIAGSLDGVVNDMKEVCIFDIKSTVNTTSSDPQQQQGVVDEIVQQIEDVSCAGEPTVCSGHGTCKKGRCICDAGKLQLFVCLFVCVCVFVCLAAHIQQEARPSQRDRATPDVSGNLVNCCTTVRNNISKGLPVTQGHRNRRCSTGDRDISLPISTQ